MTDEEKVHLERVISVQLAVMPKHTKQRYAEKLTLNSEPARHEMAKEIAKAVEGAFELVRRPAQIGHP